MNTQEEFPSSGNPEVDAAFQRLRSMNDQRFKDLEDAMLVHATLQASASRRIKEHAEFIAFHHDAMRDIDAKIQIFESKMLAIEDKVNFLIDRDMRREGGPEAR